MNRITFVFLILAVLFAVTHFFAVAAALYWYYWWFDIMMHAWGGMLIVLGVHMFSTFSWATYKPTWPVVIVVFLVTAISWEFFEWLVGLFDPATYIFETSKDIMVGLMSGVLTQLLVTANKV